MPTIPSIATRFTQRFGVRHPFACAGMAFAGLTPDLAIAVSKAGGIGAIGVGSTPPHVLPEYIRAVRPRRRHRSTSTASPASTTTPR